MKYTVRLKVTGRYFVSVDADDFEEARKKANDIASEADFGGLEDIDWEAVNATNENEKWHGY